MLETKLLLVDDEEAFAAAMEKRLTMRNIKITTTHTGDEWHTAVAKILVRFVGMITPTA